MKYRYLVVLEKAEGKYGAYAPDVPGCIGLGQTVEKALQSFRESLELYIRTPNVNGNHLAAPTSVAAHFVEVEVDAPVSTTKAS
ncbi:MAG TPA: type II toxin-antitoxin system HicB family antitoxin [Chloroflexia bacterium]|nr:type II toxin-antitoxin system HicB family antitoxin [Chloroflexia bacterium]